MTIAEWLIDTMVELGKAGVDSPRRDSLVLLEDTLGKDRAWILAHHEYVLSETELTRVDELIAKRLHREPLAYIRGKAWFYGRFFAVNKHVLIPRPESEHFIELLKEMRVHKVLDIGTGSGALAVTAVKELPVSEAIATDTSSKALALAQKNAAAHEVKIKFVSGSLFEPVAELNLSDFTVLANLPYVPDGMVTSPEITAEPAEALFSGHDGLDHYRRFWQQLQSLEYQPQHVLVESLESQHQAMAEFAKPAGYRLRRTELLVQLFEKP
jgi:release factor glutamine methyltransferase